MRTPFKKSLAVGISKRLDNDIAKMANRYVLIRY